MFCKHCEKEIQEGVKFCKYCGGTITLKTSSEVLEEKLTEGEKFSFKQPIFHLVLLYIFTFGLYGIYWFYKTWKQIKEHTKATFSPGWRTVSLFIPFYNIWRVYTLFNNIKSLRLKADFIENPSPGWLTFLFLLFTFFTNRLPDPWYLLGLLGVLPLLFAQRALNEYWEKEQRDGKEKTKLSTKEIVVLIIGAILLALSIWGTFISEDNYGDLFGELFIGKESGLILETLQEKVHQQVPNFQSLLTEKSRIQDLTKEIPTSKIPSEIKTAEQIFEKYGKAIVTIGIEDQHGDFGLGSGFLISPTGLIVTNYHVIEDAAKVAIALMNKEVDIFEVSSVVATDSIRDIAILKIKSQGLLYVILGNSDVVKPGQKVFAIGNPEGFTNTISDGIISQIREFKEGIKSFQITVPISLGSSGGALFNEMGEVIGITNMTFLWGQNINFAVPTNYVKDLMGLNTSEVISKDTSDLIFCSGIYWQPCLIGQKFHCPKIGEPFCCDGVICNDKCWSPCGYGYKFVCPTIGNAYCE